VFTFLVRASAPEIVLYLTSTTSPFSISLAILVAMLSVFFFALANVGTVLLLTWLWKPSSKPSKKIVDQAASGGSMILVALALSAGMMYLFAKSHILDLVGFDSIRLTIEETLDLLPRVFPKQLYAEKCDLVYQHVFDSYFGSGRGIYPNAP